jgi:hypothetical protein
MNRSPKLKELAEACWEHGACNKSGILRSLGQGIVERIEADDIANLGTDVDIPLIIGQLAYLMGISGGPDLADVEVWLEANALDIVAADEAKAVKNVELGNLGPHGQSKTAKEAATT